MKPLIFVLLVFLCFSCSKELEPFNPVQSDRMQNNSGDQLAAEGTVQLACFGEAQGQAAIHAHAVVNVFRSKNAKDELGEFRLKVKDQHQDQHREIVAAVHQYQMENGVCWMIGQVTNDSKGCTVNGQYQNHGEYCPYREGDCDKECDCQCTCECTCDCACQCQGDCQCDCTCECCQCLQHRLRTCLRGAENKAERTRLRTQLQSRTCGCDCDCECDCDCPNGDPQDGCPCDCHQHQWRHGPFNCHDWCCQGECCNCECCQNGGQCKAAQNQKRNGKGGKGGAQNGQHQWLDRHMMQCRVGQRICIRMGDGSQNAEGCDNIAWRWCDEKEPAQLTERLQWQLCQKNIIQGKISLY